MRRREFLAAATVPFWARPAHAKTTSKIVERLRKISLERRAALAANAEGRAIEALQRTIPEIDDIEVSNGAAAATSNFANFPIIRPRYRQDEA